jgi:xanthosine phosphorylase
MTSPHEISKFILYKYPHFKPRIGIILGSGLAGFADKLQNPIFISYRELPGFPVSSVAGHPGQLILGYLQNIPVVCCQGRVHAYEGVQGKDFKIFIRTLKSLGCEKLLITNATGSLRSDFQPGQLVLISDHINFSANNPLIGPNENEFGPRFFSMVNAYDKKLRDILQKTAKKLEIPLPEGVYFGVLGPCFETPAEIRAFRCLGGDVVGMSTVSEVIVARHCDLKVAVVSVVTNLGAGLNEKHITHEETLYFAERASEKLGQLFEAAILPLAQQ